MSALKPAVGRPAPPFSLVDETGAVHDLAHYRGLWLVLYFYPKDDTSVCTREACAFRDDIDALQARGARVLGVSRDGRDRHRRFKNKYNLPFPLLSDAAGETAHAYGSLFRLAFLRLVRRHTFIIDPDGHIAKIYRKVSMPGHSAEVVRDLERLQAEPETGMPLP